MSALGFRPAAPAPDEVAGRLALSVARHGGRSHPVRTDSVGVLRLMKPLYLDDSGQVAFFVINPGGAYFGEACRMEVEVLPGANLLLASQGATRIHRTPADPAVQEASFTVRAGGRFEYVPDQTIAYRDADYRQTTSLTVAPDAQAFVGEIVTPGWDPDGVPFTYASMRLRLDVRDDDGRLVCADNVRIVPASIGAAIDGVGFMEGHSHLGSVLMVGPQTADPAHTDAVRAITENYPSVRAGVTSGSRRGIAWAMLRALGSSTDALSTLIRDVNALDRSLTTGQGRLDLRRY